LDHFNERENLHAPCISKQQDIRFSYQFFLFLSLLFFFFFFLLLFILFDGKGKESFGSFPQVCKSKDHRPLYP